MINNVLTIFISALFCFAPFGNNCTSPSEGIAVDRGECAPQSYAHSRSCGDNSAEPRAGFTVEACGREYVYRDELICPSDFTVAEEIELRMINAPLEQKLELVDVWLGKGADYKSALCHCFPRIEYTVNEIKNAVDVSPVDARAEYVDGRFTVMSEKSGRALDESLLYASIYYSLKYGDGKIKATVVEVKPVVTAREIKNNLTLRGSYVTSYYGSSSGRAHNVEFAASKFDGIAIPPRGSASFNEIVGERTEENGFATAKIIVDGKYVDGVGGGVCQASTAVYNAALRAGLRCNANAHSICPSYCEPGLDAMISSMSDLVIYNDTEHTIYISVKSADRRTTVNVYGEPSEFVYEPESVTLERTEPENMEFTDTERKYFRHDSVTGDRLVISGGVAGVKSETYMNVYKNGTLADRSKIRENSYKSSPQITAISP